MALLWLLRNLHSAATTPRAPARDDRCIMVAIVIGGQENAAAVETARAAAVFFDRVLVFTQADRPERTPDRNLELVNRWTVEGLAVSPDGRVYGVRARRASDGLSEEFLASLVIDASGSASRLPDWLEAAGLATPPETQSSLGGILGRERHYAKIAMPVGLVAVGQAVRSFGDAARDHAFSLAGARLLAQCLAGGTIHAFQRKLAKLLKQEESVARPAWSVRIRLALGGATAITPAAAPALSREGRA